MLALVRTRVPAYDRFVDARPQTLDMTQQSIGHLLRLARWHESNNDLESAAAQYAESLHRDADNVQVLLRLGSILHRLGRHDSAVDAFNRAAALAPTLVEAPANLAVALAAAGRVDDAVVAAAQAAALAPEVALVHCNHGDALMAQGSFAAARDAYRRAVALPPETAEALNKLACAQRALGEHDVAEDLLRKALALAPGFGLALVNLGTLEGLRCDFASAARLLRQALDLPSLPPDARAEAIMALDMLGEHERLRPALTEAVAREDPQTLRAAVIATETRLLTVDAEFMARITALAERLAIECSDPTQFTGAGELPPFWPAFEAHFALHRSERPDELREALRRFEHRVADSDDPAAREDLVRYESAVRQRQAATFPRDAATSEAQLRYWHAMISWHRPDYLPGQFKPVANFTTATPLFRLVPPRAVAGSIRAFYNGPYAAVPAGPCRAVLVMLALGECHAFVNANGRVARLLMNAELESAGFLPILMSRDSMARYIGALPAVRARADVRQVVDLLADASRRTAEFLSAMADLP